jgi:hypothetical protein
MFLIPSSSYTIKTLKKKGRGVFAQQDIAPGTVIGDYLGTIIPFDGADERRDGLYDMVGGSKYDILASPTKKGIQLINHSCANNCDMYPRAGHMLYFALRKIFKGEELTVNYALSTEDDNVPCDFHACHCGSPLCAGTMHDGWKSSEAWDALVKKESGPWQNKVPGNYGTELPPLAIYPITIAKDYPEIYNHFGTNQKSPQRYGERTLPSVTELRKRIRETGLRIAFPKLHVTVDGIKNGTLLTERT